MQHKNDKIMKVIKLKLNFPNYPKQNAMKIVSRIHRKTTIQLV